MSIKLFDQSMILINHSKFDEWMRVTGRNQKWLAGYYGISKSFISQLLNNKCKIPLWFIEKTLELGFKFEEVFLYNGKKDDRQFYGRENFIGNKVVDSEEYKKIIKREFKISAAKIKGLK